MTGTSFKYRAFISYSHADSAWARWLHRALEHYRVPRRLAGAEGVRRLGLCFRDEVELAAAAELGPEIAEALGASDVLIVVCSPRAAKSPWVDKEITQFKRVARPSGPKAEHRVFALIVDGEPHGAGETECFPPALKLKADGSAAEPLAVDVRKFGRDDALLRLVGGILDVGYDDLKQREARKRRAEWLRAQTLFATGLVLAAAALAGGYFAASNYVDASEQKAALFAAAADQLTAANDHLPAAFLALHGDPAAEAGSLEGLFRPDGYAARDALVRAYTHRRLVGYFGDAAVSALAASPERGGIVVLGHTDGSVSVWSVDGERVKALAPAGTAEVTAIGLSADQRVVAAGDRDGRMRVWEVASGREMAAFVAAPNVVTRVAVSPDGRQVATMETGQNSSDVKLWAAEGGAAQRTLAGEGGYMQAIMYTPDGRQLRAATGGKQIRVWDPETGDEGEPALTFGETITAFTLADHGDAIVAGGEFGTVYARRLVDPEGLSARPYGYSLESVDVSLLDNSVLSTDSTGTARIHNNTLEDQRVVLIGEIGSAHFIDGGRQVLTMTGSNRVQLWNAYRGKRLWDAEALSQEEVAVSADGSVFAALGDGHVRAWSTKTGKLLHNMPYAEEGADLRVSADGSEVMAFSASGAVSRWRMGVAVEETAPVADFKGKVVPDGAGTTVLTGFGGGDVMQWSVAEGRMIATYPSEGRRAAGGVFAAKAPVVLIGYGDGTNVLWSTETKTKLSTFAANLFSEGVTLSMSLAISPDGKLVAAGLVDRTIWVFDTATGEQIATLTGHVDHVPSVAFSSDSNLLVSASGDGTAKLWDPRGASPLETFEPLDRDLLDIAFMPDGRRILAGSANATTLWEVDPIVFASAKTQVDMACAKLKALGFTEFETDTLETIPIIGKLGRNVCLAPSRWGVAAD